MTMTMRAPAPLLAAALAALAGCNNNTAPGNDRGAEAAGPEAPAAPAPPGEAMREAAIPGVYPASMTEREIAQITPPERACYFSYTAVGFPVLAVGATGGDSPAAGVAKLNGKLVELRREGPSAAAGPADGIVLTADGVHAEITPMPDAARAPGGGVRREAEMMFTLEAGEAHEAGFRGYYTCPDGAS